MSYSSLIQQDSPAIVWSLDDTSVTNSSSVASDRFLYFSGANGSYVGDNASIVKFPIVYGGKQSIKIGDSTSIKVPSLNKMSIKDKGNSSSLEFWIKIDKTSNSENVIVTKKDANSSAADDYETKIYIKNDYITFRLGTVNRYYEVSSPFDSVNKPLHVIASYSPNDISITVNGVRNSKPIVLSSDLFPELDFNDEYFFFQKPSDITNMQIDCIALYSYVLPRERAIRHFVYGCGYNIPHEFINYNGGVSYNFSMDGHRPIKAYDYGPGKNWSLTKYDNCIVDNGILKLKKAQEPFIGLVSGKTDSDKDSLFKADKFIFNDASFLEIQNADSIVMDGDGGWLFTFTASDLSFISGDIEDIKKTLFIAYSNDSLDYIECYIDRADNKIRFKINNEIVGNSYSFPLAGNDFTVGYIKYTDDSKVIKNKLIYTIGTTTSKVDVSIPSLQNYKIRIGSENTWNNDGEPTRNYFSSSKLKQIKKIKTEDFTKDYYTASPDSKQKRFIIKSSGTATIDINQQTLCTPGTNTTGACRIEFGNPTGSTSMTYSITKAGYDEYGDPVLGSVSTILESDERIITSGSWLNKIGLSNNLDMLSFDVTLTTDDLIDKPAHLDYFRLYSYPLNAGDYVISNSSPGGNPAQIYLNSNEVAIPDLIETPMLYNGFNSGLRLNNSYVTINHNIQTLEGGGIKSISFMLYIKSGSSFDIDIIKFSDNDILKVDISTGIMNSTNSTIDGSFYINGLKYDSSANKFKLNEWQHVYLVLKNEITSDQIITIGEQNQNKVFNIDQLIIFPVDNEDFLDNLYLLITGEVSNSVQDNQIIKISDSGNQKDLSASLMEQVTHIVSDPLKSIVSKINGLNEIIIDFVIMPNAADKTFTKTPSATSTGTSITFSGSESRIFNGKTKIINNGSTVVSKTVSSYSYNSSLNKSTITIDSALSVNSNTKLTFTNYAYENNEIIKGYYYFENLTLKVSDKILFVTEGKESLYEVSSMNIPSPSATGNVSGSIVLSKLPLEDQIIYYSVNTPLHYRYSSTDTSFTNINSTTGFIREKIRSKSAPTELNKELSTNE